MAAVSVLSIATDAATATEEESKEFYELIEEVFGEDQPLMEFLLNAFGEIKIVDHNTSTPHNRYPSSPT